jgi:hypothetical protein
MMEAMWSGWYLLIREQDFRQASSALGIVEGFELVNIMYAHWASFSADRRPWVSTGQLSELTHLAADCPNHRTLQRPKAPERDRTSV